MTLNVRNINASPVIEPGPAVEHLQRLSDLHAIQQLAAVYPILVDSHDLDPLIELFTPDATFSRAGQVYTGHDELRTFFGRIMETYSLTVHTTHQHVIDLAPGARVAHGVQMGHGEVGVERRRLDASYRYDDEYQWFQGQWRFARRQMRYQYFSTHDSLGTSLAGRQRIRVPGAEVRDAEIPEELPSYQAAQEARLTAAKAARLRGVR